MSNRSCEQLTKFLRDHLGQYSDGPLRDKQTGTTQFGTECSSFTNFVNWVDKRGFYTDSDLLIRVKCEDPIVSNLKVNIDWQNETITYELTK